MQCQSDMIMLRSALNITNSPLRQISKDEPSAIAAMTVPLRCSRRKSTGSSTAPSADSGPVNLLEQYMSAPLSEDGARLWKGCRVFYKEKVRPAALWCSVFAFQWQTR